MDILTAIHTRQSIGKVLPDAVPRQDIERLLDAAVQAPNHHRNRPWRFVVLTGAARERLGDVMAQALLSQAPDTLEKVLRGGAIEAAARAGRHRRGPGPARFPQNRRD